MTVLSPAMATTSAQRSGVSRCAVRHSGAGRQMLPEQVRRVARERARWDFSADAVLSMA